MEQYFSNLQLALFTPSDLTDIAGLGERSATFATLYSSLGKPFTWTFHPPGARTVATRRDPLLEADPMRLNAGA
jgi:hypothetical protein